MKSGHTVARNLLLITTLGLGLVAVAQNRVIREASVVTQSISIRFEGANCEVVACGEADGIRDCASTRNHSICRNAQLRELADRLAKRGVGVGDGGL